MSSIEELIDTTTLDYYSEYNPDLSEIHDVIDEIHQYEIYPDLEGCMEPPDLSYFYYTIFTLSILGNGLVLFVLIKFDRACTVNNILMSNLVASNLVFTCTLPIWAVYQDREWIFGPALCKLVGATTYVGFHSSVLFLTLVTIHRYLAVVHAVAMHNQQHKNRYAVVASVVVWLTCGLAGVAPLIRYKVSQNWNCVDDLDPSWKPFIIYLHFVAFFLLPLVVVVYCYVRIIITVVFARMSGKHRTLLIVFIILVLFFACWAPRSILQVVNKQSFSCRTLGYTSYITKKIAYLYFCINPVFYVFLKRKFKDYVCGLVCHYLSCLRSHVSVSGGHESVTATL